MKKTEINYSLQEVAEQLNISKRNLILLLRRYNIITGLKAAPEFILQGYFVQQSKAIKKVNFKKEVDILLVPTSGIKWLKKVIAIFENKMSNWI